MPSQEFHLILDLIRSQPKAEDMSPEEIQAFIDGCEQEIFAMVDGTIAEKIVIGEMRAEWILPAKRSNEFTILYLHGGGYCFGSIPNHRNIVSHISKAAGTKSLLIDYRLAPANRFPAAVEDAMAAYQWLLEEGNSPPSIVIGGDSAGGGLTLALLLQLKEVGCRMPLAVFCLSPWFDLGVTGDSIKTNAATDPAVSGKKLLELARSYLGDADPKDPLASPLYGDLSGLPAILIQVGGAEVLLDDSIRLSEKAKQSGVDVTLEIWDDMFHVWQAYAAMDMPESLDAIQAIGHFIKHRQTGDTHEKSTIIWQ